MFGTATWWPAGSIRADFYGKDLSVVRSVAVPSSRTLRSAAVASRTSAREATFYAALGCGMTLGCSPAPGTMKVLTKVSRVQAAI